MPAPPYSTGTETPSSPRPAICGRMPLVEAVLAIERLDARRDLAAGPLLHRLLQQAVFLGQIEVDHGADPIRLPGHLDRRTGLDAVPAERRRRARRDLEDAGAAEERRHFPVANLGVGADQPERAAGERQPHRRAAGERLEGGAIDRRRDVAEAIGGDQDAAQDALDEPRARQVEAYGIRHGRAERVERHTAQQPRGGRREPIASFEGPADGHAHVARRRDLDDRRGRREDRRQHAVVRSDEPVPAGPRRQRPPRAADARIDDHHERRAGREVRRRRGEVAGRFGDVVRGDVVGEVDERGVGADRERRALHRPDVGIAGAEIREQRQDGARRRLTHRGYLTGLAPLAGASSGAASAFCSGLRKTISRVLVRSRNESDTVRPSNSRVMSRLA